MPIGKIEYKPDHRSVGEFLRSDQLRDAVHQGAEDVAALARRWSPTKIAGSIWAQNGPDVVVTKNGNPRLSEHVINSHSAAAAIEFGSGQRAEGNSGKKDRPQGGHSPAMRPLGTAGAKIADRIGTDDD